MQTYLGHPWFIPVYSCIHCTKTLTFQGTRLIYSFLKHLFNKPWTLPSNLPPTPCLFMQRDSAQALPRAATGFTISCPQSLSGCLWPECPGHISKSSAEMNEWLLSLSCSSTMKSKSSVWNTPRLRAPSAVFCKESSRLKKPPNSLVRSWIIHNTSIPGKRPLKSELL